MSFFGFCDNDSCIKLISISEKLHEIGLWEAEMDGQKNHAKPFIPIPNSMSPLHELKQINISITVSAEYNLLDPTYTNLYLTIPKKLVSIIIPT